MNVRCSLLAALAQFALLASVCRADEANAPAADPLALVRRISAAYASEMRGVVALRTRTELTIDGPMFHRRTPSDPWYVYENGELVRSSEKPDARRPLVRDALRPDFLPEYHFAYTACGDCPAGDVAVAYDSPAHDTFHAHGYFVIDTAAERVRRSVEIPYAVPWPTRDARIEVTWGMTDKAWLPLVVAGTFSGKVGPFSGTARYTQQLSPYERFSEVDAAVESLTTQTGATPAPQHSGAPSD